MEKGLKSEGLDLDKLEDPGDRYTLDNVLGKGVHATVYSATDSQAGGKKVAIKVQTITSESFPDIEEEYKILRDLSDHPNLPDFYGVYRKKEENEEQIWLVMQLCDGGPVTDMVRALQRNNKKMTEVHIAFILRESLKALNSLHENHIIHRDVKASNILLTKDGEVKLVDFGISRELPSTLGRRQTNLGSPCWMAPEVVTSSHTKGSYDNRADVWALGITAIELGDGKAPFQDMHPTRALFQIVRNPPPTLYRPANWTQNYNDFIAECLVKNPEHRPYMNELMEHPFLAELPENDFHLNSELKSLLESITEQDISQRKPEAKVKNGRLKKALSRGSEPMYVEDLAALEVLNEENIMNTLEHKYKKNQNYAYIGDILMFLNPNEPVESYGYQFSSKYKFKSRSDNAPHIYGVADSAYQDMIHHDDAQHIIFSGETMSGKTTQLKHALKHLISLGQSGNKCGEKITKSLEVIHAFGNATTPVNSNSTRHALITQVTFSTTGKLSGAIFWLYLLEKWRVTGNRCPHHTNFHIFYYIFDGLRDEGILEQYNLEDKNYCYLRRNIDESDKDPKSPSGPRDENESNIQGYKMIKKNLNDLEFDDNEKEVILRTIAGILLLGEVEYKEEHDGNADISDMDALEKVASAFKIDTKHMAWALCNYCVVEKDTISRKRHSKAEALEARNVLAQTIYSRLVDWIVNTLNKKLSFSRAVFGDHHCINLVDYFGFECYPDNGLEQLFVNSLNEQLQYFYNQKIFISEMQDEEEDEVQMKKHQFYDNRETMDELLNKPNGIMYILDEANKLRLDVDFIIDWLQKKKTDANHVRAVNEEQFSVAHYTGKVTYEAVTMCSKNRDFLPPEITEVMRQSGEPVIKQMFTNKLSRTGNVTMVVEAMPKVEESKKRWGAALMADASRNIRRYNTVSKGEFSQTKGIRTAAATYRATSLEILRLLSKGSSNFVRCLRTDLNGTPKGFQHSLIKQQLRALSVIDTARARQMGFSHRVLFEDFMERYQFLAFDFDENVEKTKDNCRLLLVRLKMEGWIMGNAKVFLKYYNEEFLSRLYETQVKKIIKVQCMLRTFLAKRNVAQKRKKPERENSQIARSYDNQDEAAVVIQKYVRGYHARSKYGSLINTTGKLNHETAHFIKGYFKKWRVKSVFQVLLLYRAMKHQDLVYFSQQVHLYSQNVVSTLVQKKEVDLDKIEIGVDEGSFIGQQGFPAVWKIPFNIKELTYCDSTPLCGSVYENRKKYDELPWDEPFRSLNKGCQTTGTLTRAETLEIMKQKGKRFKTFIATPYTRDSNFVESRYRNQEYVYEHLQDPEEPKIEKVEDEEIEEPIVEMVQTNKVVNKRVDVKQNYVPKINLENKNEVKKNVANNYSKKDFKPAKAVNPVYNELQERGRHFSNTTNEDEPPYNFQAMLRKTNNNKVLYDNMNNNINNNTPVAKKKFNRKDSLDNLKNMISTTKDFRGKPFHEDKVEILPGFCVYGMATDL